MKFRKVTADKFIGEAGYSLIKCSTGEFAILRKNTFTKWGTGFLTVRAAENFLNNHDYINATAETISASEEELDELLNIFGYTKVNSGLYRLSKVTCKINADGTATFHQKGQPDYTIKTSEECFDYLEKQCGSIFASVIYRGIEFRPIFARRENRSARDITKNLVRVRSSNVWAYGIEIKDAKKGVGDVYVQFKGKNGGQGDLYRYYNVEIRTWRKFLSAPSKGHFVWQYLRNNYLYSKLTGNKRGVLPNAVN